MLWHYNTTGSVDASYAHPGFTNQKCPLYPHPHGSRLPSDGTTEAPTQNAGANARCTRIGKLIVEIRGSSITAITRLLFCIICSVCSIYSLTNTTNIAKIF